MGRRRAGRRDEFHRHMWTHETPITHTLGTSRHPSPTCHTATRRPHSGRSGSSLTTACRKSLLATSPCGSGAAWALPESTWWGKGPSENSGRPSQPAPHPPFLLRCPGSLGTGTWPRFCREGWCLELRPAHCPIPAHRPLGPLFCGLSGCELLARVFDSGSPDSCPSEPQASGTSNLVSPF